MEDKQIKEEELSAELQEVYPIKGKNEAKGRVPWAYEKKEGDPNILVPVPRYVAILEEALDHLDNETMSVRKAADWVSSESGKYLSHQGLLQIWNKQRKTSETLKERALKRQLKKEQRLTREQRKQQSLSKKIKIARLKRTTSENRLKKLEQEIVKEVEPTEYASVEDLNIPEDRQIVFQPNPGPQTDFLAADELEVLYGGAAGGGKSYALLVDPMRYFGYKNFNGILLRRTNDELRELIWKSKELYPAAYPGSKFSEKKSSWTLPAGGNLWMTYLERDEDVLRYQGQAFTWIGFDELTQYPTPFPWNYLRSRLRTTDPDLKPTLAARATTNPGGPGHGWVKKMFIDPAPPGVPFPATDIDTGKPLVYPQGHEKEGQPLFYRRFIPASLSDNPYLTEDGAYEANLLSLPEHQRRQLLDGDWSVVSGAAFGEWRPHIHTCKPFQVPHDWRKFRSCDFGYSTFSAVHWYAIDPNYETLWVYRELYTTGKTARDLAREINQLEEGENIQYGVLDSSCWHTRGNTGPTIAEEMIQEGCRWRPSDRSQGSRVAGKNRLHELLKEVEFPDGTKRPGIVFFDTCRQIIADLPMIPVDPKGSEDIDPRYASDHAYDSIRYGIQSRPRARSPFDDWGGKPMNFYRPADSVFGY